MAGKQTHVGSFQQVAKQVKTQRFDIAAKFIIFVIHIKYEFSPELFGDALRHQGYVAIPTGNHHVYGLGSLISAQQIVLEYGQIFNRGGGDGQWPIAALDGGFAVVIHQPQGHAVALRQVQRELVITAKFFQQGIAVGIKAFSNK